MAHADMSYQLKAATEQYKPGKFPHLAGSKVFKVPDIPLEEVNTPIKCQKQKSTFVNFPVHQLFTFGGESEDRQFSFSEKRACMIGVCS